MPVQPSLGVDHHQEGQEEEEEEVVEGRARGDDWRQRQQQQQMQASSTSSFGTGAEPLRDEAIANAWLSGSRPTGGSRSGDAGLDDSGGGGSAIFGPTSGRLPSYRRSSPGGAATATGGTSTSTVTMPSSHLDLPDNSNNSNDSSSDALLLGPYDADDGLGDYRSPSSSSDAGGAAGGSSRWNSPTIAAAAPGFGSGSGLVLPHLLPTSIAEEKEEIASDDEIEEWADALHRRSTLGSDSYSNVAENMISDTTSAPASAAGTDVETSDGNNANANTDPTMDLQVPPRRRSLVRFLSEDSDLSVSVTEEDDDYYTNEEDGGIVDDLDDELSDGDESWHRRRRRRSWNEAAAAGGGGRGGRRSRWSRGMGAAGGGTPGSAKRLASPSAASMAAGASPSHPVRLCGITLPLFLTTCPPHIKKPSWNRVSSYVVRHAPCFWCGTRLETSATDREVLGRLNILCAVFAAVQGGSGLFLFVVQNLGGGSPEEDQLERQSLTPNLWSLNGMVFFLGLVGIILFVTMILTLRVVREVNLVGAVRYMWALYWILPIEILLVISLFDYHKVTDVWIRHWWLTPSFDWFRSLYCLEGTADTKCMVPTKGGAEYEDEDAWCTDLYNATDCLQIKTDAQMEMSTVSYIFLTANAVWGLVLVVLLWLALTMLEGIITPPIVQSSKQANIPAWLTLPFLGCLAGGATLLFAPSSAVGNETGSEVFWIGVAYMASGGCFLVAALLGWFISAYSVLNSRDKQHKQIAVSLFIATMLLTIFILVVIFAASLVFSVDLVDYGISKEERGRIACYIDTANSCTNCYPRDDFWDPEEPRCPEWTNDDILKVLQTQLKQSATLAAIFLIYAFSALRFGFVLRSHVSRYQIEYV